jgi:serine/threonine-protein kinase PknG
MTTFATGGGTPPLQDGALVGGQYRVEHAIGRGGLGWVYLAWDCRVGRSVALKGLIDPTDEDMRQAVVTELKALAEASHPNIVTVFNVVRHPHPHIGRDIDYIVMEYLEGKSLQQLRRERPSSDPYLPVHQVCEFALEVLAALKYLHERRGLLYCDLSPDNVIHSKSGVKLIDLGAVRRIDDQVSPIWGKIGYQDPAVRTHGPSVATDLYTVARMMAVLSFLFPGFFADEPIPGPDEVELLATHPSFDRLLHRATNPDPHQRFASAAEMAEQLDGVLREIRAVREGRPFPAVSARFGSEPRVVGADPGTFLLVDPEPVAAALALPDPRVASDPHADLLTKISDEGPEVTERVLAALPDPSLETRLRVVRARIELRHPDTGGNLAALAADQQRDDQRDDQRVDWRVDWYRGLKALVDSDVDAARRRFTAVFDALPGEAAPKLALALCAERAGAAELATQYYATVWWTDHSYVSAAFGLARVRFALGDIVGAATALEAVPESSYYADMARLCAILARVRGYREGQPLVADFFTAADQLNTLDLDPQRREWAIAEVLETVLCRKPWSAGIATAIPDTLLGHPLNERGVRDRLERAYRELARLAPTRKERIAFVDKANKCRNRSWR